MRKHSTWITTLIMMMASLQIEVGAQSIAEKKAYLKGSESDLNKETEQLLAKINDETVLLHEQIHLLYQQVDRLYESGATPDSYKTLLKEINQKKAYLINLETRWRELASRSNRSEGYGLWHAPETTLEQLVIDYGSQDYVYLIPLDISAIRLSVDSNLPIPRSSWTEMLELILSQNGVGIKQLNPYLRQLYLIKDNNSSLKIITDRRPDLEVLPPTTRVSFLLEPEPSEIRRSYTFLEKFINHNTTTLQVIGRDILVTGQAGDILDLLKLYDFVGSNRGDKDYRLIPIFKTQAVEMAKILEAMFDQANQEVVVEGQTGTPNKSSADINGIKIVPLENITQAIFVVGTREEVRKAEEVVRNVESKIGGAHDKQVYWYTVKHSDPEELAEVLYRVYTLMLSTGASFEEENKGEGNHNQTTVNVDQQVKPAVDITPYQDNFYQEGGYIVNPRPIQPKVFEATEPNKKRDNFIVDPKTSAIVMVVEVDILPKIKDLLKKLDVPKKMVQIETMLFEKVLNRENNMGLNLLRIGEHIASNTSIAGALFNNIKPGRKEFAPANAGVFEFLLSRQKSDTGVPAFDLAYRFLLTQDDVQINSNPSILTVNQVPATIAINEEISINTGVFEVPTTAQVSLKSSFTRAQYGITISIKPTIHMSEPGDNSDDTDYVTLETDITFDTLHPGSNPQQPDVTRRHIENQVQIPDGDTVIIGGLRRKTTTDRRDGIPLLCELPGLGKLFGITHMKDNSTEMFIFITPHIVKDPKEQLQCLRQELLCIRPGDLPYFLECVEEAHRFEKSRLMEGSMNLLFGRPRERYYVQDCCEVGEYDGR